MGTQKSKNLILKFLSHPKFNTSDLALTGYHSHTKTSQILGVHLESHMVSFMANPWFLIGHHFALHVVIHDIDHQLRLHKTWPTLNRIALLAFAIRLENVKEECQIQEPRPKCGWCSSISLRWMEMEPPTSSRPNVRILALSKKNSFVVSQTIDKTWDISLVSFQYLF